MREQIESDVCIVPFPDYDEQQVSPVELRLLSSFFPEILKEMMVQAELNDE